MSSDLRDHLRALEEELLDPKTRKSAGDLERLLADDFIEIGSTGEKWTRQGIIAALMQEPASTQWSLSDFSISTLSDVFALAMYRATKQAPDGKIHLSTRSSIWKNARGHWQMIFHQGTPLDNV